MIREIKSLLTSILARIVPATTEGEKEINAKKIVHRRVEVTMERETLSILVPHKPTDGAARKADGAATDAPRPPSPSETGGGAS